MLLVGAIPDRKFPLSIGEVQSENGYLIVNNNRFSATQGTGAMISAALTTTKHLGIDSPHVLIAGDIGDGLGTREIYNYLSENICKLSPNILVLHYCQPIMALMKRLCHSIKECLPRPEMIADAGAMYAAKGAGLAKEFDLLTPDPSEIAFLADPLATHPAYIAEHLFSCEPYKIPEQIVEAYKNDSAATYLLVKGETDYVARDGKIIYTINEPDVPTLEAIGGTGDTITGLVSAFLCAGFKPHHASFLATKTNRMAGKYAKPTPATKVKSIIDYFPTVFTSHLDEWKNNLTKEN
jgi:NAD(P)H-hydrate repair Nnr-like enzyme with NAD(P)H-hydrate dehydratase domain